MQIWIIWTFKFWSTKFARQVDVSFVETLTSTQEWQQSGQSRIWTNLLCLCQLERCPRGTQAKPRWHLSVNTISKTNVHHSQDTVTHVHSLHRARSHICEKSRANSLSHAHSPAHWHTERLNTICSLCAFPVVLCCALCNIYVLCAIYMYFVLIALDIPCCARAHCFCVWTVQNMHFVLICLTSPECDHQPVQILHASNWCFHHSKCQQCSDICE